MKAVRFYAKEDVRVEDVPTPNSLGGSQVLIKPLTCGICGTDLHEFAGGREPEHESPAVRERRAGRPDMQNSAPPSVASRSALRGES